MCNNNTGLEKKAEREGNSPCFLRSSAETRVSPQASPNHRFSNGPFANGPFHKVSQRNQFFLLTSILHGSNRDLCYVFQSPSPQTAFILQPSSLPNQPAKAKEPPRYEDAIKQSRNLQVNISQVGCTCLQSLTTDHRRSSSALRSSSASLQFFIFTLLHRFPRQPVSRWMICSTFS